MVENRMEWFSADFLLQGKRAVVEETAKEGEAKVTFTSELDFIHIKTPNDKALFFLKERKLADGIILQRRDNDVFVHVIECKKNVKEKNWVDIKSQWGGALQTALAVCGVLGWPAPSFEKIKLYTAYRKTALTPIETTNPTLLKMPVGLKKANTLPSVLEWQTNEVFLLNHKFEHRKIQLDGNGVAAFELGW